MRHLILLLCIFPLLSAKVVKTKRFAGRYSYGSNIEKSGIGSILIYPETDSTVLFYLDVNRGAPSYNSGNLYSRLRVRGDSAVFRSNSEGMDCSFLVRFYRNEIRIRTLNGKDQCYFGYGVKADGRYRKRSSKTPLYYTDATGQKVYFSKTKPRS